MGPHARLTGIGAAEMVWRTPGTGAVGAVSADAVWLASVTDVSRSGWYGEWRVALTILNS